MPINKVEGDNAANPIDLGYTADIEGDQIDNNDAADGSNDDVVDGFGGDDTILSEDGNDTVYAGSGNDSVDGGIGDDVIFGDSSSPDAGGRESFEWDLAPDPDDSAPIESGDPISGFTQNTGTVEVTFSQLAASGPSSTNFAANPQTVDGIDTDGAPADPNSSLAADLGSEGTFTDLKLEFSEGVENISFRINDLDGDENIRVYAFDEFDNLVPVTLTGGAAIVTNSTTQVEGSGASATLGDDSADNSVLVDIPGPAVSLVIRYEVTGPDADGINVTDVYFDAPGGAIDTGMPGDDTLSGGEGDDSLFGEEGDDVLTGGAGADSIEGGDGSDSVFGGAGDDFIDTSAPLSATPLPDLGFPPAVPADGDPENDRDFVSGGDGNDTIITGDDADTITGGAGNDLINAGIDADLIEGNDGNDTIVGSEGSDTIHGGAGDDLVFGGLDPSFPDELNIPDAIDPVTNNGQDLISGGAGNDTIFGQDDDDTIFGGTGHDVIDGGIDDDVIDGNDGNDDLSGGDGDDSLRGQAGADTLDGGLGDDTLAGGDDDDVIRDEAGSNVIRGQAGNDSILGGIGADTISGGSGDDTIDSGDGDDVITAGVGNDDVTGGAGNDSIRGQDGDDVLSGGDGNDTVQGGNGNDTIYGGDGADDLQGRADADVFLDVGAGDTVDGGTGDTGGGDFDTLDLTGQGPLRVVGETVDADGDSTSGTVEFLDADGLVTGALQFREIENLIPCFTPGTVIATPRGEKLVEELQVGDRIITRDNGLQEIRWIGHRALGGQDLVKSPHLKPVLIRAGALGQGLPERDMLVSPQHRILLNNERAALYFEEREVLAAAKHLTGLDGVDTVESSGTTYIHFMFDQHEVVLSNGAWTESFQPGEQVLDGMGSAQRDEIYDLFPELRDVKGLEAYQSARRSLKRHEAQLLVK